MKDKSPNNRNKRKENLLSKKQRMSEHGSRLYNQRKEKLQLEDYLYAFPTCNQGSSDAIYLDEITVYYSFS